MKTKHIMFAAGAFALCAACGGETDSPSGAMTEPEASEMTGEGSIDMAAYGFLDGQMVSPIDMPGWFPESITLPDDFVAVEAREIGTRSAVLRGVTAAPMEGLYDTLSADLEAAGYSVRKSDGLRADNLIYFGGQGYEDSGIRLRPGPDDVLLDITLARSD
ncbi:MAG: hypothetical protein AAF697_04925 [Pseudomonadota bacterium]